MITGKIIYTATLLWLLWMPSASARQDTLTLDDCIALALQNNKKIAVSRLEIHAAKHKRKAAFTDFLPKISLSGAYMHNEKSTSLLSENQKELLGGMGTAMQNDAGSILQEFANEFPQMKELAEALSGVDLASPLDALGSSIADALTPDTRNVCVAALSLTQPLFMGGKIIAYNKICRNVEEIARNNEVSATQETILSTEQAYRRVVSLSGKQRLAASYVSLIRHLHDDVSKMKKQGVATEADVLRTAVRLNEAEIALQQADNAIVLARMLLCYTCGLPLENPPYLADENGNMACTQSNPTDEEYIPRNRPDIRNMEIATDIYRREIDMARADYLPQVLLTANYIITNPSLTDGFRNRFDGMWNIGVMLRMPLWNWCEGKHNIRAAKARAAIAQCNLDDALELSRLQVAQARQRMNESIKRLTLAESSIKEAEENLRNANIGFDEGVLTSEQVMEAQTGWLQAHSSMIDATTDAIMARAALLKALGKLTTNNK